MAFEKDDIDAGLLVAIGLAGTMIVIAGSYLAAGIYWEHRAEQRVLHSVQPAIERTHAKRDAELATLQSGSMTIEQAMAAVAEQKK
jgi:hypothetical protein